MQMITHLKQRMESLLFTPGQELSRWARFLRFQIYLWRFCTKRLRQNNAMAMSAALSFRTIFALIPTIVLMVVTLKSYDGTERAKEALNNLMEVAGISNIAIVSENATDTEMQTQSVSDIINQIVDNISDKLTFDTLGATGIVVLIWASITLLTTMERSLNRIYGARCNRAIGKRILFYWSVITLGPLAMTAANYMFDNLKSTFPEEGFGFGVLGFLTWLGPVIVGIILLAMLYKMMPNTKVGLKSATAGAAIAVLLWLLAKWGFGLYVSNVGGKSLYGALGLLPLFLMWINLSWLIFLFGAELSHTAAHMRDMQQEEMAARIHLRPTDMLAIMLIIGQVYQKGDGAVTFDVIRDKLKLPDQSLDTLLDQLVQNDILYAVEAENGWAYIPARPLANISVSEIIELDDWQPYLDNENDDKALAAAVKKFKQMTDEKLGNITLAELIGI